MYFTKWVLIILGIIFGAFYWRYWLTPSILCDGPVLRVTQSRTEIIVENVSTSLVSVRISWDNQDPNGTGAGEDSFATSIGSHQKLSRNFKEHTSVQVWAWDTSGVLEDSCNSSITPLPLVPLDISGDILYQGTALLVNQTKTEIIVTNISPSSVTMRVSWDNSDPNGVGVGEDSFITRVESNQKLIRDFKEHTSVQVWVWDESGILIDSCNQQIK